MASNALQDIDDGWQLEVGTTVTFLCATIIVSLRTYARYTYARLGWDDGIMLFALVNALIATILDFIAVKWGLGRHLALLTHQEATNQQYWSFLAQVFCVNALTFAKISICFSYLRVLRGSRNPAMKWTLYVTAVLVFVVNTMVIITFYAQCNPPPKAWDPSIAGTCWKPVTELGFILLQGSFSALTDFFLAGFPFLLFKELQVSKKNKAILTALMGLGAVTGIFAVIRTVEASSSLHPPPNSKPDPSFSTILGLLWAGMERNVAIIIASVPAMRPLAAPLSQLTSRTFGIYSRKGSGPPGSYEMGKSNKFTRITAEGTKGSVTTSKASKQTTFPGTSVEGLPFQASSEEHILYSKA